MRACRKDTEEIQQLESNIGRRIELNLCARSDLSFAIRRGYERLEQKNESGHRIGDKLIAMGLCSKNQIEEALRKQRGSYARLGDILVQQGSMSIKQLQEAEKMFSSDGSQTRFGEFLVDKGFVVLTSIKQALLHQANSVKPLGKILVEMNFINKTDLNKAFGKQEDD